MRKGTRLSDLLLVAASTLVGYLTLEWIVFPMILPHLPLRLHGYLGELELLAQSSKSGLIPRHYVAVFGDSYAQGAGDWLLQADPDRNEPFDSVHVLHQLANRDAITFGRGGAGSFEGLVSQPLRQFRRVAGSPWYSLEPPESILVYFYEGNDFDDNLRTLRDRGLVAGTDGAADADRIDRFVADEASRWGRDGQGMWFPALRFAWGVGSERLAWVAGRIGLASASPEAGPTDPAASASPAPPATIALIGGRPTPLPDRLQGPALELRETEIDSAVSLFKASLAALHRFFPRAAVTVVYIPSPLSIYRLASPTISVQSYQNRGTVFPAIDVQGRSHRLCLQIRAAAVTAAAGFLDARIPLRAAAADALVHGPGDWKHLNRDGQVALGRAAYEAIAAAGAGECGPA